MRAIRYAAWALVVIAAAAVSYVWLSGDAGRKALEMANVKLGGPFELVRADGTPITDKDIDGTPHAIFFGFTHCPEVCPTTLLEAAGWLERARPGRRKVQVLFHYRRSGARHTAGDPGICGVLRSAHHRHHRRIRRRSPRCISDYRVYAKRVELEGGDYTMDHTATVYLIRADGSFAGTIAYDENPDVALEKLRRLIKNG